MTATFDPSLEIATIQGADYNPRLISEASFENLKKSIGVLGAVKPILVNSTNRIIIAGHQRTKAMKAIGVTHVPAMMMDNVNLADEMRFNQFHNATDENFADVHMEVEGLKPGPGYQWVGPEALRMHQPITTVREANKRHTMLDLIVRFGNWGSVVCDSKGNVLVSKQYAICTKVLRLPLLVYVMPDEKLQDLLHYFGLDYGVYDYSKHVRKTYNQAFCQLTRLAKNKGTKGLKRSHLYETCVLPNLKTGNTILDFGAGRKEYANRIRKLGYDVSTVEFFSRIPGTFRLDIETLNKEIDNLCERISSNRLWDIVVCDSVLNSVDTQQAEDDVLHCLNFFTRMNGLLFVSGRPLKGVHAADKATKMVARPGTAAVQFLDSNGIGAIYRSGKWTYQKFHTREQMEAIGRRYINRNGAKVSDTNSFQIWARKTHDVPDDALDDAIMREFNLPLPSGATVNRHLDVLAAVHDWRRKYR